MLFCIFILADIVVLSHLVKFIKSWLIFLLVKNFQFLIFKLKRFNFFMVNTWILFLLLSEFLNETLIRLLFIFINYIIHFQCVFNLKRIKIWNNLILRLYLILFLRYFFILCCVFILIKLKLKNFAYHYLWLKKYYYNFN